MSNNAKKVILISHNGYSEKYDSLLQSFLDRKINLFCVVGKDCDIWEESMDWICVGKEGEGIWHIITTSHPNESVEEVINFAKIYKIDGYDNDNIQIIEI